MPYGPVLLGAAVAALLFVALVEVRLALRGYRPTVPDTEARWVAERERAGVLGRRALILLGNSRLQLDADLDVLRARSGLEPVQLSINAASFVPVLEGLARDPAVTGSVLVGFNDEMLAATDARETSYAWQAAFDRRRGVDWPTFDRIEPRLADAWRSRLRAYADGARPLTAIRERLMAARPRAQYLVMDADRAMRADYTRVVMPDFYYQRVLRNLGHDDLVLTPGMAVADLEAELARRIAAVEPDRSAEPRYRQLTRRVAAAAGTLQRRGARVWFVMLPSSGWVRVLHERRYPREWFWDRFAAEVGAPALHFADVPALAGFECPDGSHLDYRQARAFSAALVDVLGLAPAS